MFEEIEFPSEGAMLRGRFYRSACRQAPALVMAHGTSATITMVADQYAAAFNKAGLNVLLYDHLGFGASGGEPRQQINPWVQGRGYRDAVNYLRDCQRIKRVALWGDSYSAAEVLVVGALVDRIAAVVAQTPATGTELPPLQPSDDILKQLRHLFAHGNIAGGPEHTIGPMPVVSPDQSGMPSLLKPIQAYRWFIEYGGGFGSRWVNHATRVIPPTPVPFNAYLTAPYLQAPTLMLVGRDDEMVHCNRDVQQAVFQNISARKKWYEIDGGHFGLVWHSSDLFAESVECQIEFLRDALDL
jgi:pimeloyl-ACP methyl ester carboxylesterase